MENSTILFDEFMEFVFSKLPEPFHKFKEPLMEEYQGGIIDDLYDVWYYYSNGPTMRYINNYYEYNKYDPKLYKRNMFKAIHYLCKLEQERIIETTRKIIAE